MLARCARSRPAFNDLAASFRPIPHNLRHRPYTTWRQSSGTWWTLLVQTYRNESSRGLATTLVVSLLGTIGISYWYDNSVVHRIEFREYEITKKESVSNTASIFHLAPVPRRFDIWGTAEKPINFQVFKESWDKSIWNTEVKQPDISVTRPYTPLPPQSDATGEIKQELRLLVRNQEHGEVSPWIHRKAVGASLRMRGPFEEYEFAPLTTRVIFLAGGTGIATALQAAHVLLGDNAMKSPAAAKLWPQQKQIHIMWANREREDCTGGISEAPFAPVKSSSVDTNAVVAEIENLKRKFPHQLTVDYFIDEDNKYITEDAIVNAVTRFPRASGGVKPGRRENVVFVSGSDGFISYIAGPKMWNSGRQDQGLVSGVVARALARAGSNAEVVKV